MDQPGLFLVMLIPTGLFGSLNTAGYNWIMAQEINASFIPKKEVRGKRKRGPALGANLFLLIAVIIFLTALLASLGVFLWSQQLQAANSRALNELEKNRDSYGISAIQTFIDTNNRET